MSKKYEITKIDNKTDLSQFTEEEIKKFELITKDLNDDSILEFGSELQSKLSEYSDDFLNNVRAFDAGEIGSAINDLLSHISYADPNKEVSGVKKFLLAIPGVKHLVKSSEQYFAKYDSVSKNIEEIATQMDKSRLDIIKDNVRLSELFEKNEDFAFELEDYIIAGHIKLDELNEELETLMATEDADPMEIKNLQNYISRLSKRVHDMELTRVVTVQTLPQIKMVQDNNYAMADKISATLKTTVPVWKNQIALAVTMKRQGQLAGLQEEIYQTTNNIIKSNAENLKTNSIAIAKQNERGFISTDSIKEINDNLISTLTEINKIKDEGQKVREQVEREMKNLEKQLKQTLAEMNK